MQPTHRLRLRFSLLLLLVVFTCAAALSGCAPAGQAAAPPTSRRWTEKPNRRAAPSSDGMRSRARMAAMPSRGIRAHRLRFQWRWNGLEEGKDFSMRMYYNAPEQQTWKSTVLLPWYFVKDVSMVCLRGYARQTNHRLTLDRSPGFIFAFE